MDNMYSTIGENMRYFMYKYKFSTDDWYRPLSFLNNKIDTYVNGTVNFDIVCTATAIKELCQARDMGDTQLFNRQKLTGRHRGNCLSIPRRVVGDESQSFAARSALCDVGHTDGVCTRCGPSIRRYMRGEGTLASRKETCTREDARNGKGLRLERRSVVSRAGVASHR